MRRLKLATAICTLILLFGGVVFSVIYFTKKDTDARVVTTIFPIYDMCREIMGSDDDILLLENNGSDMHSYSPTASDITTIAKADLFIFIGGESDNWIGDVIRSINNMNLRTLSLIDEIDKLEESDENILETEEDSTESDEEIEYDEHIWLSPNNAIKMVRSIQVSLTKVFPEKELLFKTNADEYVSKLQELEEDYSSALQPATKPIIVADRFPFRYLVNDYNLEYFAIFSGCSAETEASASTIANLISRINEYDVNYIIVLETSDQSIPSSVINASNCKAGVSVLVINSCQSVGNQSLDDIHYLDIMRNNLNNLKKVVN